MTKVSASTSASAASASVSAPAYFAIFCSSTGISAWFPLLLPLLLLLFQFQPQLTLQYFVHQQAFPLGFHFCFRFYCFCFSFIPAYFASASESCTCCGGAAWSNQSALVFSKHFRLVSTSASASSTASVQHLKLVTHKSSPSQGGHQ